MIIVSVSRGMPPSRPPRPMTTLRRARSLMSTTRGQVIAERVDPERVLVIQAVVEKGRRQVVGRPDRMDVAGQVEVEVLHRDHLAVAPAGGSALDPEDGPQRRLTDGDRGPLADPVQALDQARRPSSTCLRPAGVGVMPVTRTYLPRGLAASRRSIAASGTLALRGPYCSISSSRRPSSRAIVDDRAGRDGSGDLEVGREAHRWTPAMTVEVERAAAGLGAGGLQDVGHQQGVGHRPDAAGDRRDRTGDAAGRLEIDVADERLAGRSTVDHVDPDIDHRRARLEHRSGDQAGLPGCNDHDVGRRELCSEVGRSRVADRHRGVLAGQQDRRRPANHVRTTDDHGLAAHAARCPSA